MTIAIKMLGPLRQSPSDSGGSASQSVLFENTGQMRILSSKDALVLDQNLPFCAFKSKEMMLKVEKKVYKAVHFSCW